MPNPSTTAVFVTYRSRSTIDAALEAARACHAAGELHTVVVDNSSNDGTLQHVRDTFPFVETIDACGNLGFGRGCNLGAEAAQTRYVVFINPDAVLPLDALQTMVRFMDDNPNVGICAPFIEGHDVGKLLRPRDAVLLGLGRPPPDSWKVPTARTGAFRTNWVCGAIMMVRSELFKRIGGFDPRFFLYFEETDLCRRCEDAGGEIWVVTDAVAQHDGGVSTAQSGQALHSGCIAEHYFQSRFYYFKKHYGLPSAVGVDILEVLRMSAQAAIGVARGKGSFVDALRSRVGAGVLRPPDPL